MSKPSGSGIYGKLPAYGDFIIRNLKPAFVNQWDEWLQRYIAVSREQIGEGWLDVYLTSPIWRFVMSPGVIDSNVYAGVMMPSVDRVGRYFPISVINTFSSQVNPIDIVAQEQQWFQNMEDLCLSALNGEIDADELVDKIAALNLGVESDYIPTTDIGSIGPMTFEIDACDSAQVKTILPYLLNATLSTGLASFSIWMTSGSERIPPLLFSSQGLPQVNSASSMLDGGWKNRNWKMPYSKKIH